jgi:hypothetical protein
MIRGRGLLLEILRAYHGPEQGKSEKAVPRKGGKYTGNPPVLRLPGHEVGQVIEKNAPMTSDL